MSRPPGRHDALALRHLDAPVALVARERTAILGWAHGDSVERLGVAPARFEREVRAGEAMEPEAVLREVHVLLGRGAAGAGTRVDPTAFILTPREGEVLRALGEGLSDRDLADRFGISAKTASVHVANIKAKLGVRSRLEAAIAGRALADRSVQPG